MRREFNPPDSEFDQLLRRRIRQQAGREPLPTEVCQGFDPDLAAAYLERALSGTSQQRYEAHLTVCTLCRRQLTQLAWLEATVEGRTRAQDDPSPTPSNWWEPIYQGINDLLWGGSSILSGEKTRLFGMRPLIAGTAFALLIGVVAGWQLLPTIIRSGGETPSSELTQRPSSSVLESRAEGQRDPQGATDLAASNPRRETSSPPALARVAERQLASRPSSSSSTTAREELSSANRGRGSARQAESVALFAQGPVDSPVDRVPPTLHSPDLPTLKPTLVGTLGRSAASTADLASRSSELTTRIPPLMGENPMSSAGSETALSAERRSEGGTRIQPSRGVSGFVASGKGLANPTSPAGRLSSPPARRILDKTFYLTGGTWVDDIYFGNLRVRGTVRLTAGSEDYAAVLREHPELAEYFQLRPVTVVWQGIVYRVTP